MIKAFDDVFFPNVTTFVILLMQGDFFLQHGKLILSYFSIYIFGIYFN